MSESQLSKKSRLRTGLYPDGIRIVKIDTKVNAAGNVEIAMFSQKGSIRANVLEVAPEDMTKFRRALSKKAVEGLVDDKTIAG